MNASRPAPRRGLGRGLGSLIPTGPAETDANARPSSDGVPGVEPDVSGLAPVVGAYFAEIPVGLIQPNRVQPRQVFDEEAMAELVHSIKEIGVLQPIVVRRHGPDDYELVMGERRWRASQQAGLDVVPAIVRETDDVDMLRDALLENLHRSQLNPLEEAAAYSQMLEDFGCTHDELAGRIGRSRPQISNTLRRPRPRAAGDRRSRPAGPAGPAGDRRGHQRARPRGDRRGARRRCAGAAGHPQQALRPRPRRPGRAALGPLRDPGQGGPGP